MNSLNRLFLFVLFTSPAFASGVEPSASTKAIIDCTFSNESVQHNYTPKHLRIEADLATNTAKVAQKDADGEGNGNTSFSILTCSRASDSRDREMIKTFSAYENPKGYAAPNTLVMAANNGDDTDQTIVVQYRPSSTTAKEMEEIRAKGGADFMDVNVVYMGSVDGNMSTGQAEKCTMKLK